MKSSTIQWLGVGRQAPDWSQIPSVEIDCFPWYEAGRRQGTSAKVAVSDMSLHARFECDDRHISAQVTQPNGRVCDDSCVEFFFAPDPEKPMTYFNLEINCCGTVLLAYGPGRHDRLYAPMDVIESIEVQHSIPGPTKLESPDDDGWWVEAELPLDALLRMVSFPLPMPGSVWKGNFYRCGGRTDPQYACWAPIDLPEGDFHRPEFFGLLRISKNP